MAEPEPPDPPTFEAGIESLLPRLVGWAHLRLRGKPGVDPADLAQEVVCRALAHRDRFVDGNLQAWVFQIAKHVLFESLRGRQRADRIRLGEGHGSQFDLDAVSARLTTLTRAIARRDEVAHLITMAQQLDETDHTVLVLCGLEGLTAREAGVQVGLAEEATQKRWYRLRQRLREAAAPFAD